jgi:hypothetical protein
MLKMRLPNREMLSAINKELAAKCVFQMRAKAAG